jgi:exopolysaccharide biosynthesis WecB/TagA/CpsF family protein
MVNLGKWKILRNFVTACDYDFLLAKISEAIKNRKTLFISPTTTHILARAYFGKQLSKSLNNCDFLIPDSQWVKRSLYFLYGVKLKKRVYGPTLVQKVFELAQSEKLKIFLYGVRPITLKIFEKVTAKKYPNVNLVSSLVTENKSRLAVSKTDLIKQINTQKPNIIFVALGSDSQDNFSYELLHKNPKLNTPVVIMPVGAAFDFLAEVKPQAPQWVMETGFEWAFRLYHEPLRLWKRYIIYGPIFVFLIIIQKIEMLTTRK